MTGISEYRSRTGLIGCSSEKIFRFVTDLRNLGPFVPRDTVNQFTVEKESATFKAGMVGSVNVQIADKIPCSEVVYTGNALGNNTFTLTLSINEKGQDNTMVDLKLAAGLNSFLKMMADEPIRQALEMIITEMEKFRGWDEPATGNR